MPFPVIKLVGIIIKQASKPLAALIKRKAKESEFLKTSICIPPAQWYHRMDVRLKMWTSGAKRNEKMEITPLSEDVAIDVGAEMLGEIVIFTVAAGVVALEYWRQVAQSARKEKKQDESLVRLRRDVNKLLEMLDRQETVMTDITKLIDRMEGKDFKLVKIDKKSDKPTR